MLNKPQILASFLGFGLLFSNLAISAEKDLYQACLRFYRAVIESEMQPISETSDAAKTLSRSLHEKLWLIERELKFQRLDPDPKGKKVLRDLLKTVHEKGVQDTAKLFEDEGVLFEVTKEKMFIGNKSFMGSVLVIRPEGTHPLNQLAAAAKEFLDNSRVVFSPIEVMGAEARYADAINTYYLSVKKIADPRINSTDLHELVHAYVEAHHPHSALGTTITGSLSYSFEEHLTYLMEARAQLISYRAQSDRSLQKPIQEKLNENLRYMDKDIAISMSILKDLESATVRSVMQARRDGKKTETLIVNLEIGDKKLHVPVWSPEIASHVQEISKIQNMYDKAMATREKLEPLGLVEATKTLQLIRTTLQDYQSKAKELDAYRKNEPLTDLEVRSLQKTLRELRQILSPLLEIPNPALRPRPES